MSDKQLKSKAIKIKGKDYVQVSDRIIYFNETYSNGSISTQIVGDAHSDMIIVKATVLPDSSNLYRKFTGYSQAVWGDGMVNKTAALENAETSAVGRALAMLGIGVIDSVASSDEVNKATSDPRFKDNKTYQKAMNTDYATDAQINAINKMIKSGKLSESVAKNMSSMTKQEASDLIGSVYGEK